MKISKIAIILILAILAISAVSANDSSQDTLNSTDEISDILLDDEDMFEEYADGTGTQDSHMNITWPDEIKVGEFPEIKYELPNDADYSSHVVVYINNERIDDGQYSYQTSYPIFIDEYGTYTLKVKFTGDNKYAPYVESKTYDVNDFIFTIQDPSDDGNLVYGMDYEVEIELPYDAEGSVVVCGEKYEITDETTFNVTFKNLQIGTNSVEFRYSGDEKYKPKTVVMTFNVIPDVVYQQHSEFDNVIFSLTLPSDVKGDFKVTVDNTIVKTSKFTNGFAQLKFDDLKLGGHNFKSEYVGDDFSIDLGSQRNFEVIPKIRINSFASVDDENTVTFEVPEGEIAKVEVVLKRYASQESSSVISEDTRSGALNRNTTLSFSTLYYGYYVYSIKYNSTVRDYFYSTEVSGYVKQYFDLDVFAPSQVLASDDFIEINVTHMNVDEGNLQLFVDGEFYDEVEIEEGFAQFYIEDCLSVGEHTISVRFINNDRYLPVVKSTTITSAYVMFNIPDEIIINSQDIISLNASEDTTGYLVVYVDGKEFKRQKIANGHAQIDMSSLAFKTYSIRVAYEGGNYPQMSQTQTITVSYTFLMGDVEFIYGEKNLYSIDLPKDISTYGLTVMVDNEIYPWQVNDDGVYIDVSHLEMGPHIVNVDHPGDGKYYAISLEKTISITGKIKIPQTIIFGSDSAITLILPKNPQGKMAIYEYEEYYNYFEQIAVVGFEDYGENSIAEFTLSLLNLGEHKLKAAYLGSDYNVSDETSDVNVNLDLKYNKEIQYGQKMTITIYLGDAEGEIDVYLDGDYIDVAEFINGKATIVFDDLEVGQHTFELAYYEDYSFDFEGEFGVYPVMSLPQTIIDGAEKLTVKSGDPAGSVFILVDGKKLKEVDIEGDTQKISLSSLGPGTHTITLLYDSWDDFTYSRDYTVNIKKATITAKDFKMYYLSGVKYKVLIKNYKGKAVGKGQSVKFYVDGKLFKTVKTDKKGYAYVVFTHAPKEHTLKIVYKATTVTKKLTVKQVVTLKKVAVKRSAKKLTLTATLKSGKKAIKNKQVTFKFAGKTFKVKTNAKGVAKVTVKSNVLKKLKAGKKVAYSATYVKATVKQSVVVKK